jgi:hypothetical protein
MGKNVKKIQIHDTTYSDYFKNELGKSLTNVDVSSVDTTLVKKSEDRRQLSLKYKTSRLNPDNSRTETITVSALPGADFTTANQFLSAISSQISGTFLTHDIESTLPYRSQTNNQAEFFYSLRSKYSYYARGYEEQATGVSERLLPNYYIQKSSLEDQKSNFSSPNKDFFQSVGTTQSITFPPVNNQKGRNIVIDNLNSVESIADQYPMYNEIKFVSAEVGDFTNFLNQQNLMPLLISDYSNPANTNQRSFDLLTSELNAKVAESQSISIFSLANWIQNQTFDLSTNNITLVDGYERDSFYSERLKKYIFNGIMRTYTQRYLRTYEQIVNTEPCYTEVLFYKVDKYVNNIIGDPVQTYWVSNKEELNIILDTQIKYGTSYSYDVKQVIMVLGNSYSFGRPVLNPETKQFKAEVQITNRPSIQMLEIPFFSDKIVSIQSPPQRPQVHFSTKMNSDRSIKISLSHTLGEDIQPFTTVETADLQQLSAMNLFAPNYSTPENEYYFQSDGVSEYYEVYRLDRKPKSYTDFAGNKLKDAKSFFEKRRESSSHVSVNDFIIPNRKYYYMFRAVNIHNHKSNPTIVYEVELIQDADDSKVMVDQFIFETPPTFMNTKRFNSLFQIEPALQQRLLDNDQPSLYNKTSTKGTLENIKLGNAVDSIWGRDFKIRITSTATGRKIDFNVNFNVITSKTEEDFE